VTRGKKKKRKKNSRKKNIQKKKKKKKKKKRKKKNEKKKKKKSMKKKAWGKNKKKENNIRPSAHLREMGMRVMKKTSSPGERKYRGLRGEHHLAGGEFSLQTCGRDGRRMFIADDAKCRVERRPATSKGSKRERRDV